MKTESMKIECLKSVLRRYEYERGWLSDAMCGLLRDESVARTYRDLLEQIHLTSNERLLARALRLSDQYRDDALRRFLVRLAVRVALRDLVLRVERESKLGYTIKLLGCDNTVIDEQFFSGLAIYRIEQAFRRWLS